MKIGLKKDEDSEFKVLQAKQVKTLKVDLSMTYTATIFL